MDDLLRDFLTESNENLLRLDQEIVELEKSPGDLELLKSIFRTIHTIKGTCGFLDLARLERVAHAAENVLGQMRDGKLVATSGIISDVLAAIDVVKLILEGLESTEQEPAGDDSAVIARLDGWLEGAREEEVDPADIVFPVPVIAPPTPKDELEALFLQAQLPQRQSESAGAGARAEKPRRSGRKRSEAKADAPSAPPPAPVVEAAAEPASAAPASPAAAAPETRGEAERSERSSVADSSLRVNVDILDQLMNLAGELVLSRNQLHQMAQEDENSRYTIPLQHLNRVTSDLQEVVMKTRMQPIGNAWGKLPRLVRDLSQASGKRIDLEMQGAETELDRQILQAIQDPLTHMIRNSADHGIEPPATRKAAGKRETGTIRLEAYHEGGQIIIEIRDDGKGLDVEAIRAKTIAQGLLRPEQAETLTESQIFKYIFEPGFSTAEKVTNVSGRGVGMDVVRSNIERIGGAIELSSTRGKGTTIRIKIPLTLAILSALLVGVQGQTFAIPQVGVVELVRITDENRGLAESINGSRFFRLRETLLPLVGLGDLLRIGPSEGAQQSLVVCNVGLQRFGIVVDEIFDTHEIVVKPIGRMVKQVRYYSGTTILGDGRVIMILDVPSIASASKVAEQAGSADESSQQLATQVEEERMPLVVFRSGPRGVQAVPLALVSRLEKIPAANIEWADGRYLVQYRGSLLQLIPASPEVDVAAIPERPVIVFSDGEKHLGLAVDEIQDIVEDRLRIEVGATAPGTLGTAVIAGRSTEVLDINAFLRSADGDWFGARRRTQGRRRVLLVDDSPFFLNIVGPALQSSNYEVAMASDGQEALSRLEQGESFDVIVSDIDMPRVDGFELARRVAANPIWSRTPLLALTGRESEEDRALALSTGFRDFLRKFDREAVLTAIQSVTAPQVEEEALA